MLEKEITCLLNFIVLCAPMTETIGEKEIINQCKC